MKIALARSFSVYLKASGNAIFGRLFWTGKSSFRIQTLHVETTWYDGWLASVLVREPLLQHWGQHLLFRYYRRILQSHPARAARIVGKWKQLCFVHLKNGHLWYQFQINPTLVHDAGGVWSSSRQNIRRGILAGVLMITMSNCAENIFLLLFLRKDFCFFLFEFCALSRTLQSRLLTPA